MSAGDSQTDRGISKDKWLAVLAYVEGFSAPLLAQYAKAPDACSVTEVNSMFGPGMTMEISRDGDRAVVDQNSVREGYPNGFHTRSIYDLQAKKTYSVVLGQADAPCGAGTCTGDGGDPLPAACSGAKAPPTEAEKIAAATGGNALDFANAIIPPASPSPDSCTVLLRVVRAGSMTPVASGFQVALDKAIDFNPPAAYQMGVGPVGR